ncbi:hypothetical protein BU23DRAFT_574152 [Bimuria novae-zelandiae CBS 107.79]|uniref:Uncharacterized protein n=1 Tax=Bimuria novae-zelandiae CBS 107.79 TaxID=1447943 RepID=A0A6A5UZ26_9PLEO|nr:hypothetical protein BU23DRAFT_574152 [Bimuria novae-zelandiae CBS 107.79]
MSAHASALTAKVALNPESSAINTRTSEFADAERTDWETICGIPDYRFTDKILEILVPYDNRSYLYADVQTPETNYMRLIFLISLAGFMVQFLCLEFDSIGMSEILFNQDVRNKQAVQEHGATVGPSYHIVPSGDGIYRERGPFVSTKDYFKYGLDEWRNPEALRETKADKY